jgi:hypothetical protein
VSNECSFFYGKQIFSEEVAMSPDKGLLRSVFSKRYMSSNRVTDADGLSSACVLKGGLHGF